MELFVFPLNNRSLRSCGRWGRQSKIWHSEKRGQFQHQWLPDMKPFGASMANSVHLLFTSTILVKFIV